MRTDRLNDLGWNLWRAALLVPVGYVAFVLLTQSSAYGSDLSAQ